MNKAAQQKETNQVECVVLHQVRDLLVTSPLVEDRSVLGLGVTDPGGGGETAGVGQTVRVSSPPTGVVPVLRSRHSTAPGLSGLRTGDA